MLDSQIYLGGLVYRTRFQSLFVLPLPYMHNSQKKICAAISIYAQFPKKFMICKSKPLGSAIPYAMSNGSQSPL